MKHILVLTLMLAVFAWVGCQTLPETARYSRSEDNPDRASFTPGTPIVPTATDLPPDFPTATPTDDRGSATPCDPDGCPHPTATDLPSDWPTSTLNPDQIYLTQLAQTPQPTIDLSAQQTHEAGGG